MIRSAAFGSKCTANRLAAGICPDALGKLSAPINLLYSKAKSQVRAGPLAGNKKRMKMQRKGKKKEERGKKR